MRRNFHVFLVTIHNTLGSSPYAIPQFRKTKEHVRVLLFDSGKGGASDGRKYEKEIPFWIVKLGNKGPIILSFALLRTLFRKKLNFTPPP